MMRYDEFAGDFGVTDPVFFSNSVPPKNSIVAQATQKTQTTTSSHWAPDQVREASLKEFPAAWIQKDWLS